MPEYAIPAQVLQNAEKRLAARIRATTRMCVYDGCDQAATHWPATGSPACETHRTRPVPPTSDPARRLYALRDLSSHERAHLAEEQLLTVRITYRWASEGPTTTETAA
ncbi:MAG: hypothetical protein JWM40_2955 [Frankiales bacterium]|nr:hypothetical protein [Frankiales bacterium]